MNLIFAHVLVHAEAHCLPATPEFLLLPKPLIRHSFPPTETFTYLVPWFRFLCSKSVSPYWDEIEYLGVKARKSFDQHDHISSLTGSRHSMNARSLRAQQPKNSRFSLLLGNTYLAGPAGLINHACSEHANCVLDFQSLHIEVSVSSLEAGSRIYYTYSNEDDMLATRGFTCNMCRFDIIQMLRF